MKARYSWQTIAVVVALLAAAVALITLADEREIGMMLVVASVAALGLAPMPIKDANGNNIADGESIAPPGPPAPPPIPPAAS